MNWAVITSAVSARAWRTPRVRAAVSIIRGVTGTLLRAGVTITVITSATRTATVPVTAKAARQPRCAPIHAATGSPSTSAAPTPPNATVSARAAFSGIWATATFRSTAQYETKATHTNSHGHRHIVIDT